MSAIASVTAQSLGRCLVVGHNGYVGRHLAQRLVELGCTVRGFDLASSNAAFESEVGDVRDYLAVRRACEGIDTVFHTAALINTLTICRDEIRRRVFAVNVGGTDNVIRACKDAGVSKLVYTSSIAVVAPKPFTAADETAPYPSPDDRVDLYGRTKSLAEARVLAANNEGALRTASIRPGGVWGPGQGAVMVDTLLRDVAAGRFKALVGKGDASIDNSHVDNVVDGHLLAAHRLGEAPEVVGGQAYFITDDEPMNGVDWYRPIIERLGYRWPKIRVPAGPLMAAAYVSEMRHFFGGPEPVMTLRAIRSLTTDNYFRIDKARRDLGYEPRVQLQSGLDAVLPDYEATIAQYRKAS